MKRLLLASLVMVLLTGTAAAQSLNGTPHNLSGTTGGGSTEVCKYCHTPHNALINVPLWSRTSSVASYNVYTSSTMGAATGQPNNESKMCLSCHDGTVGINEFLGTSNPVGLTGGADVFVTGAALVGTDLRNDHPVSFTYTNETGLVASGSVPAGYLFSGRVECSSCHNAHINTDGAFLRSTNAASALCRQCHTK